MTKLKAKVVSLILGAGILMSGIPGVRADAASANPAIENTKKQIISMSERIDKQLIRINDLTDEIRTTADNIQSNEDEITSMNQKIRETEADTEEARLNLNDKTELYSKRLREVYKNGNTSVIETLLGAESLSDLLLRYKVVRNIARHDKELVDSIAAIKKALEEKTRELENERNELAAATDRLKENKLLLDKKKTEQQQELSDMKDEKARLRDLLETQEVALFDEIERILKSKNSTEEEVSDALDILATIQAQVTTSEAIEKGTALEAKGQTLLEQLKAARLEAERLAREKAEAERKARELEAQRIAAEKKKQAAEAERLAAEKQKAEELAAEKEAARKAAEQKADELEADYTSSKIEELQTETSSNDSYSMTFTLTFYTDLPEENGGWTITATGDKLTYGVVANNVFRLYTRIYLEGYGTMTVKDRGGSNFNTKSRLDVFIPRRSGETNTQYLNRVNNMGVRTVQGRVLG